MEATPYDYLLTALGFIAAQVNLITGIYLHDPPPFNCPFFMTPPFSEAQKVVTPPLFPPPLPPC